MSHVLIRSPEDCEAEAIRTSLFEHTTVSLDVGLEPGEERLTEARLNRLQNECGCAQTGIVFLLAFVPALVLLWTARPTGSSTGSALAVSAIAFVCALALASVAKLTTIWVSRRRYRLMLLDLARKLHDKASSSETSTPEAWLGGDGVAR